MALSYAEMVGGIAGVLFASISTTFGILEDWAIWVVATIIITSSLLVLKGKDRMMFLLFGLGAMAVMFVLFI